ncbi:MAG: sulfatase, partial [Planctomycetota bacterium]
SPNLDALAAESLFFERCLVPMATTLPVHTSIFTGVFPLEHGVLANLKTQLVYERDASLITLTEVFAQAGYDTAAFVSAFPLRAESGLTDGFDVYDDPPNKQRRANVTTNKALSWLNTRGPDAPPFFLWVHYFDPHSPYNPPGKFAQAFELDDELRRWMAQRGVALHTYRAVRKRGEHGRLVDLEGVSDLYDGEVLFTDHHLGRLLDSLRDRGLWSETVVVAVGDHGEGLNQHREPGHGLTWGEQLHVPYMMRIPGVAPRSIGDLVSVVDLAPTLLGLLELPGTEAFLGQARGLDVLDPGFVARPLSAQSSDRQEEFHYREETALTTERWKLQRRGDGGDTLYDLQVDPFELCDVAVAHPQLIVELSGILDRLLADQRSRAGGTVRAASAEELAALRGLGYDGGGEDHEDDKDEDEDEDGAVSEDEGQGEDQDQDR